MMFNINKTNVLSTQKYNEWLTTLAEDSYVVLQQFQPKKIDFGVITPECFIYSLVRVADVKNKIKTLYGRVWFYIDESHNLYDDGIAGHYSNFPNCFPARIIPIIPELINLTKYDVYQHGDWTSCLQSSVPRHQNNFVCDRLPIYEPFYWGFKFYCKLTREGSKKYHQELNNILAKYPYNYYFEPGNETIYVFFTQDDFCEKLFTCSTAFEYLYKEKSNRC